MDDELGEQPAGASTRPSNIEAPLGHSVILIAISIGLGAFVIWLVQLDWVLDLIAGLILLGIAALGVVSGWLVYRLLSEGNGNFPHWARLTSAVILGFAMAMTAGFITHSHKLIRYYEHWSSDSDQ